MAFFSMPYLLSANKRLVYEEVKKAVARDRSTVKVSELSRHGLMEITRKRVCDCVVWLIFFFCLFPNIIQKVIQKLT